MKVLTVTGGIGSGKSLVCRILHDEYGFPHYDSDARVKWLYDNHPHLLDEIEKKLGESYRDKDGSFCASALAGRIFSDRKALEAVESLVFPALMEDFRSFAEPAPEDGYVVFESATILEKPQFDGFSDFVVVVDAPFDVRLKRAACRDGAGQSAVMARMANQSLMNRISEGEKDERVDFILDNSSSLTHLKGQIGSLIKILL